MSQNISIPTVRLHNGVEMPMEGYGVFQIPEAQCREAVSDAIDCGYRLIDTARTYKNEKAVGEAIREAIRSLDQHTPYMLDVTKPSEIDRLYDYLNNPVLTSL